MSRCKLDVEDAHVMVFSADGEWWRWRFTWLDGSYDIFDDQGGSLRTASTAKTCAKARYDYRTGRWSKGTQKRATWLRIEP